jgi:gliding motility-associated lipoprotein GldH
MKEIKEKGNVKEQKQDKIKHTTFKLLAIIWLSVFCFVHISCKNDYIFNSAVTFETGWHKDTSAVFNVYIPDTSKVMDFILTFKHLEDYGFCNLWIFASTENIEYNTLQKDTIELFMSYDDGRWFGKKKGKYRYISTYFKHDVKVSHPGNYIFQFRQGMRVDNIEEIKEVSFKIMSCE